MFSALFRLLVPKAFAVLDGVGSGGAGVDGMWEKICSTFPANFCGLGLEAPQYWALRILDFVFAVIGGAGVIVIIYAGIKMIVSQGNEEAQSEAKKIIFYAAGGIVLALLAEGILAFVRTFVLEAAGQ